MSGIALKQVSKRFGDVVAVDNIDLDIAPGEFVSILGPSGCGKTTLLRMLAGLERPSDGQIRIGDVAVNDLPPGKRDIAMVFQSYALYPHMTVAGNIEYPLKKRKVPKPERARRVAETAELLQLVKLMQRKPRELSGGQQQRVALGRALVRDPAVFLLDEPLSNLDAKLRAHMRAELIRLHETIRRTMIYVTHDQLEAMTMSDRIAVLLDGRLQQFATPQDVYARPANAFVAGFVGTPPMNLIDGELAAENGKTVFRSGDWTLGLEGELAAVLDANGERRLRLGVRPEDLEVAESGAEARVQVVEPIGHEVIVVFDLAGNEVIARVSPELTLRSGDLLRLAPRVDRLHFFSAADGRRISDVKSSQRSKT